MRRDWSAEATQCLAALKVSGRGSIESLGSFEVFAKSPRLGRHPETGEPMPIPAMNVVRFTVAPAAADAFEPENDEPPTLQLPGLGTLMLETHEAYEGRNFSTGETVHVPASNAVIFRPGVGLREAIAAAPAVEREE